MLTVCCVKVGTRYPALYANRLGAMVKRHLPLPHRFVCLTDSADGLEVECEPLAYPLPGWWAKLFLFRPRTDRLLYFDLDTIVCGDLTDIASYDGPFAILQDFYRPTGYGSAVMSLAPGEACSHVWRNFTPEAMARFHGDQNYIESQVFKADLWQNLLPGQLVSYKCHVQKLGRIPANARVVNFHGTPKNADLPKGDPLRHLWEHAG